MDIAVPTDFARTYGITTGDPTRPNPVSWQTTPRGGYVYRSDMAFDGSEIVFPPQPTPQPVVDAVPAPATLPLLATGLGMMAWFAWRKKRKVDVNDAM